MSSSFRGGRSARWRSLILLATASAASLIVSCTHPGRSQNTPTRQIEPNITFYEADQPTAVGTTTHLWVYLPAKTTGRIPCVVIAPAGSPLVWGMNLADGDRPEHLPYVRAGFAVVAYTIDGEVPDHPSTQDVLAGLQAFRHAHGGVSDTYAAIDYVRAKLPQVDPKRLYVAGHSSAGTLALLAAESDPRIKGGAVYAPACDVAQSEARLLSALQPVVPDINAFAAKVSPITRAADLHCPLFIFHADDDTTVPSAELDAFVRKVSRTNPAVTVSNVAQGGHYDSMITVGVPRGVAWLKSLH